MKTISTLFAGALCALPLAAATASATALATPAATASAAERPAVLPDTLAQRLIPCASCHAKKDVNDAFFPRISGKPAGYLYNQLLNFKEGRRQFPTMTYMVDRLPDSYLKEIADYFSGQQLPHPPHNAVDATPAMLARGQRLVNEGDAAIKVPACAACHGTGLTGVAPAIPGLAGLPRDYLNAQLGAWRNGSRHAHAPDCMATIAGRLSLADVAAISGYIASQPLPADTRPLTTLARPLALPCGSAPD